MLCLRKECFEEVFQRYLRAFLMLHSKYRRYHNSVSHKCTSIADLFTNLCVPQQWNTRYSDFLHPFIRFLFVRPSIRVSFLSCVTQPQAILFRFGLIGRIWVRIGPKVDQALRMGGRRYRRTYIQTEPLVFYRTLSPSGPLLKKLIAM